MPLASHVELSGGVKMPRVGLGTFKARGTDCEDAVVAALQAGFRHVDTASIYKNHDDVRKALKRSCVPREEIFLVSKISPYEQGFEKVIQAVETALRELGTDYVDLMLIHWPGVARIAHQSKQHSEKRLESWRALEKVHREGRVRAVGVSNYCIGHLQELLQHATVTPAVNQVECHPRYPQAELRSFCEKHDIAVVAYASYGCGDLFAREDVQAVCTAASVTPNLALLRWGLLKGCSVIPKSVNVDRIRACAPHQVLAAGLPAELLTFFDTLDDGTKYCWDPSSVQ